ncbi:cyclin N-terminal domain-containing protein 1 isoform X2 [Anabrus simplex]|uniref:cyclin N-terminal domain-containing protein 1 isoform X2 n=1 Tax=Anabrus simplex TaxID=316456 RepID=UPI0035A3C7DF
MLQRLAWEELRERRRAARLSDHLIEDWWHQLKLQNKAYFKIQKADDIPYFSVSQKMVHSVFTIGNILQQTMDVQFLTIELLDRFLCNNYSSNKRSILKNSELDSEKKRIIWLELKKDMKNTFLLRILSCMQLASKYISNLKVIIPNEIQDSMRSFGYSVSIQEIIKSERLVYKTCKFTVPTSPLVYIEHLIYMLPPAKIGTNKNMLYTLCAHILGLVYTNHKTIYDSLYHVVTSKKIRSKKDRMQFLGVECDRIYLASAIVLCAADLYQENFCWVLQRLEALTDIPLQDIEGFAAIINDCSLGKH